METQQTPIGSGFGAFTTASEVIQSTDLSGKIAIVTGGSPPASVRRPRVCCVLLSPLGRGFLTGEVKRAEEYPEGDFRRTDPRYQGANFDANVEAAKVVFEIAIAKNVKPGQIALAWILQKGNFIEPIRGTKRGNYLEKNVADATVQLDTAQMKVLDDA